MKLLSYFQLLSSTMLLVLLLSGFPLLAQQNPVRIQNLFDTQWEAQYSSWCGEKKEFISAGIYQRIQFYPDQTFQIRELGYQTRHGEWQYEQAAHTLTMKENEKPQSQQWQIIRLDSAEMILERELKNGKCQRIYYEKVIWVDE
jgi:hypothetical protein